VTVTNPFLIRVISFVHVVVYRASRGRIGASREGSAPVLLLTTRGRRTRRERTTPLIYLPREKSFVVVASYAGNRRDPAWWLNLQAHPAATVQAGAEQVAVSARRVEADEERELWPLLDTMFAGYRKYRERTARPIPVVALERTS